MIGYTLRKVFKIALIIGLVVFSLFLLFSTNIIEVDYSGLSDMASRFVETVNPALNLITQLLVHISFIVRLIFGLAIGFKRGD